ncbi:MAG: group III truncated hemoglobin [Ferruginibacter sp.]
MDTKKDIETRSDIEKLVVEFYEKVKKDETIGIIFTEIVKMDWEHHIPLITDFWETIILDNPVYKNNAMEKHYELNRVYPLTKAHFDAWLILFNDTMDGMYSGPKAAHGKARAASIAAVMQFKMGNEKTNSLL